MNGLTAAGYVGPVHKLLGHQIWYINTTTLIRLAEFVSRMSQIKLAGLESECLLRG